MTGNISTLEDHTGYWLRCVSNHVSYSFARKLTARDTTVAEWALMRVLYARPPQAPSQVALQMGITKGAITRLAQRLIAKSLVVPAANLADGRAQTIALTEKGENFVPELAALADQNERECFSHLSADDHATLQRILRGLAADLSLNTVPVK